jgi:hypothetical protein
MKLSVAAFLLLSPVADGFTPNSFQSRAPLKNPSSSALGYVDSKGEGADLTSAQVELRILKEDRASAALAESLGLPDTTVRNEYANWLMTYEKTASESRYHTFKKNFLQQEEYNRKEGMRLSLNKYGDCTEGVSPRLRFFHFVNYSTHVVVLFLADEYYQVKGILIEEEIEIVEEPNRKIIDETELIDEAQVVDAIEVADEHEALEQPKVEIVDESVDLVAKYEVTESAEERAFEVVRDMGSVKPAPQHLSLSNFDVASVTSYLDTLGNPDVSAIDGAGSMISYLGSIRSSDTNTFAKGKSGNTLGATASHLDGICDMIEPFFDTCGKGRAQPMSPQEEDFLQEKYSAIKNLGDRAYQILVDLCMDGRCKHN